MKHLVLPILVVITATSVVVAQDDARKASADTLDAETLKSPFSSVIVREKDVVAANKKGLFRASLDDKKWKQLPVTDRMPLDGIFGQVPKDSDHLLYHSRGGERAGEKTALGLYHSTDSGKKWRLLSGEYDFRKTYLHRDGTLYAIAALTIKEADKTWFRSCVLRAATLDIPLKWEDISGDIEHGIELYDIVADPVRPELVRLRGHCVRNYIIHAEDTNYHWKVTANTRGSDLDDSDDAFLRPVGGALKIGCLTQATLANYFDHPFGDKSEIHAWSIHTDSNSFTFGSEGPKTIPVSVRFSREDITVGIPDVRDSLDCWAVRIITPTGKRIDVLPQGHRLVWRDVEKRAEYRTRKDLLHIDVNSKNPYSRSIDLDKLGAFTEPGKYRVRLSYHSDWLAENDEWAGCFCSEILAIDIR